MTLVAARVEPVVGRPGWREVPGEPSSSSGGTGDAVLAWLVAAAGAVGWLLGPGDAGWVLPAAVAAVAAVGAWAARASWCERVAPAALVAAGTGLVVAVAAGRWWIGAWVAAGILVGWWVLGGRGVPRAAVVPVTALSVISGVLAWWGRPAWMVAFAAAGTVVVPFLMVVIGPRGVGWIERFAHGVWLAVTWLLFGLLSVVMVLFPFVWGRLVRSDGFGGGGRWITPPRRVAPAGAAWSNDRPGGSWSAWRTALACAVVAGLLFTGWRVFEDRNDTPDRGFTLAAPTAAPRAADGAPPDPEVVLDYPAPDGLTDAPTPDGATPAALADSPWWNTPEYQDAEGHATDLLAGWRFENPYRMLDVRSRYINVVDGIRTSWTPPPCNCRRLTVWMYGGSTTWGISQRDDHTIASELARVAHENGITVDVQNRGLPGFHHWLEAERFAWDLTTNPRPDLVVFYDGVNDRFWQPALADPIFANLWDRSGRSEGEDPAGPAGSEVSGPPEPRYGGLLQTEEGVRRYDRAREMSRATATATGVPVRYVWQPERYSRPFVGSEPHFDTGHENDARRGSQFAWERLAPDVIDLHDALKGNSDPIYTDDVHHNEVGARLIAEALYDRIAPDLRRLTS